MTEMHILPGLPSHCRIIKELGHGGGISGAGYPSGSACGDQGFDAH